MKPSILERVVSSCNLNNKRKKQFKTKTKSKDTLRELTREFDEGSDSEEEKVRTAL